MVKDSILIFRKRIGGTSCFNLSGIGRLTGKQLAHFKRLDKKYGHSKDLVYALETGQFVFVDE